MKRLLQTFCMGCVALFFLAQTAYAANHYVLLVGVGAYKKGGPFTPLTGPPKDVAKMKNALTRLGYTNIVVLLDGKATKANIQKWMRRVAAKAGKNDPVIFYFSGHGSRVSDPDGDEPKDNLDETLVPYDVGSNRESHLIDDEIAAWIRTVKSHKLTLIFDSCHSGGAHKGMRAKYAANPNLPRTKGARGAEVFIQRFSVNVQRNKPRPRRRQKPESAQTPPGFVFLSASQAMEFAYDVGDPTNSVLTHYLVQGLASKPRSSASELIRFVTGKIRRRWPMTPFMHGATSRPLIYSLGRAQPVTPPKPAPAASKHRCKNGFCAHFRLMNKQRNLSTTFRNMQELNLFFRTNKAAYVTIFNVDYKGKKVNLFPGQYYSVLKQVDMRAYRRARSRIKKRGSRFYCKAKKPYFLPAGQDNLKIGIRIKVNKRDLARSGSLKEKFILFATDEPHVMKKLSKAYQRYGMKGRKGAGVFIRKHNVVHVELHYTVQ